MDTSQQQWEPCPAGELTKMVNAQRAARRRKVIDRFAVGAASVMAFIAIGGYTLGLFTPENGAAPSAITCRDCIEQMPAYAQGNLDETTRANVAAHLDRCKSCHTRYEQMIHSVSYGLGPALALAIAG